MGSDANNSVKKISCGNLWDLTVDLTHNYKLGKQKILSQNL